jgi:hypothetical protein
LYAVKRDYRLPTLLCLIVSGEFSPILTNLQFEETLNELIQDGLPFDAFAGNHQLCSHSLV